MRPYKTKALPKRASPPAARTERHYHKVAEEFYFILEGAGEIELDGERRANVGSERVSMELVGSAT